MRTRGFTIIELLVTITIMLLLLAGAAIGIERALANHRDAIRINDVLAIGKAVDQSQQVTRGIYPGKDASGPGTKYLFCAQYLDPTNLNLTAFQGHAIPTDPTASSPSSTCTSYLNGYTVHTDYGLTAGTPADCSAGFLAACQSVTYSIEVGLENDHSEGVLHQTTANDPNTPPDSTDLTITGYTTPASSSTDPRNQYILNGPVCGSTCYK